MKIEIYEDTAGEYRWRAVSRNGSIVADSGEGYFSRSNASRAQRKFFSSVLDYEEARYVDKIKKNRGAVRAND